MIMIEILNTNAIDFDNRLCHTLTGTLLADYKINYYSNIKQKTWKFHQVSMNAYYSLFS